MWPSWHEANNEEAKWAWRDEVEVQGVRQVPDAEGAMASPGPPLTPRPTRTILHASIEPTCIHHRNFIAAIHLGVPDLAGSAALGNWM